MSNLTTLERAFAMAQTGRYSNVSEIRAALQTEGYFTNQLEGPSLQKQLRELCTAAKDKKRTASRHRWLQKM